jgi:hypothetical protein
MKQVDIKKVEDICREFGILTKSRKRELIYRRAAVCNYLRNNTKMTLEKIGELLGGKDHATVLHSLKTYNDLKLYKDVVFLQEVKDIELSLYRATRPDLEIYKRKMMFGETKRFAKFRGRVKASISNREWLQINKQKQIV